MNNTAITNNTISALQRTNYLRQIQWNCEMTNPRRSLFGMEIMLICKQHISTYRRPIQMPGLFPLLSLSSGSRNITDIGTIFTFSIYPQHLSMLIISFLNKIVIHFHIFQSFLINYVHRPRLHL